MRCALFNMVIESCFVMMVFRSLIGKTRFLFSSPLLFPIPSSLKLLFLCLINTLTANNEIMPTTSYLVFGIF